ncbi:MAG: penicillin-binding protein activator [Steroidobacteraceae bacterium]
MQVQKLASLSIMSTLFGLLLFCMLTASATTTSSDLTKANQSRLSDEAEQLFAQGRYNDASSRFETLATQASSQQRDHWLLKAARSAQLAGNDSKTQTLLDAATSNNINNSDSPLRVLISATLAVRTNQAARALSLLDQIALPLPAEFASELLATRVEALFSLDHIALAVRAALDRERLLTSTNAISESHQQLWNSLKQAAAAGSDLTPPGGVSSTTAGWMELAKLTTISQRDPFGFTRQLNDWRTRYPNHPGSDLLTANPIPRAVTTPGVQRLALLLPLSGKYQAASNAIRDGFIAAALQQPNNGSGNIDIFDTNESGVMNAYTRALQGGANMIIGPLLKEDVELLASSQQVSVTTLALNTLSDTLQPPGLMFQFALDPEEEARQAAQRALDEGHRNAIVLAPNNDWGQRVQRAFTTALTTQGGSIIDSRSYDANSNDHVSLVKQLFAARKSSSARKLDAALNGAHKIDENRHDFDFIFMAAQATQARQLRPAIRFVMADNSVPIYAISDSYDPDSNTKDIDDLRVADMPWIINRNSESTNLYTQMNAAWGNTLRVRSRLYAFGIDAFKLSGWLYTARPQLAAPLQGTTGLLALDQVGRIHRQLEWAQIVNGAPQFLPDLSRTR